MMDDLTTDDIHIADASTIEDMGYDVVVEDGQVVVTPGEHMERFDEPGFVGDVFESLGFEKVRGSRAELVFEAAD